MDHGWLLATLQVVDALKGTVFRKDPPRTIRTKAALLRTRFVDAHSENSAGRLRWFTRKTAFSRASAAA